MKNKLKKFLRKFNGDELLIKSLTKDNASLMREIMHIRQSLPTLNEVSWNAQIQNRKFDAEEQRLYQLSQ